MTGQKPNRRQISDLRVLVCGVALEQYPRDDTLWGGLSRSGVGRILDLRRCQNYTYSFQKSLDNRHNKERQSIFHRLARKYHLFNSLARYAVSILQLPRQFIYALSILLKARWKKADIILVFPRNRYLAIWLGILRFLHGARLYVDLYESVYENAVAGSRGRLTLAKRWLEEFLCIKLADQLLCVTSEYAKYYQTLYKASGDRFSVVHDGVQDVWLDTPVSTNHRVDRSRRVLYWGTFLARKHGLDMVISAAEELRNENIEFMLCGGGQQEAWVREQARGKKLSNIVFKGYVPTSELIHLVDSADITLGHLKDVEDERLAPSNKLRQGMARSKPVINIWTRQKEELYQTKGNPFPAVVQIEPDAKSLTKAIKEIIKDPPKAEKIGKAARLTVERFHSTEAIAAALRRSFEKAL